MNYIQQPQPSQVNTSKNSSNNGKQPYTGDQEVYKMSRFDFQITPEFKAQMHFYP